MFCLPGSPSAKALGYFRDTLFSQALRKAATAANSTGGHRAVGAREATARFPPEAAATLFLKPLQVHSLTGAKSSPPFARLEWLLNILSAAAPCEMAAPGLRPQGRVFTCLNRVSHILVAGIA